MYPDAPPFEILEDPNQEVEVGMPDAGGDSSRVMTNDEMLFL